MKQFFYTIKSAINVFYKEKPFVLLICTILAFFSGFISPVLTKSNSLVLDYGIQVAQKNMTFTAYFPYLLLFVLCILLSQIGNVILCVYIEPQSRLILRTTYKGELLKKLKKISYEHMENTKSIEIIEKAYNRAEEAALHIFPNYYYRFISSLISLLGVLYLYVSIRWWFAITIIFPFIVDTCICFKTNSNIYEEMDKYWNKEHYYTILGNMLKSSEYVAENKLWGISKHLINIYRKRLSERNKEFEKFYFKNLKRLIFEHSILNVSQLINAFFLLVLYIRGDLQTGQLISLTLALFSSLYFSLENFAGIFKWLGQQIKAYEYYDKYFELSETKYGTYSKMPLDLSIEFRDVCFSYPNSNKNVLNHLNLKINSGEKVAIVGENGAGKSTFVKLLLGLFEPNSGEILIGGIPLKKFSKEIRDNLFSPVFQDFNRYAMTLKENIFLNNSVNIYSNELCDSINQLKIENIIKELPVGINTLLGREFDGGVDLSGGQWQRIAIARAIISNKSFLILDEPTSQLDPIVESEIYSDYASIANKKTSIFITHRLGAVKIVDRILVLSNGMIIQEGTHNELVSINGQYSKMFNSQKQWYNKLEE